MYVLIRGDVPCSRLSVTSNKLRRGQELKLFDDAFCVLRLFEGAVLWDANFHGLLMGCVFPCTPDTDSLPQNMASKPHSA
jgi:hypothetical protein